ncbi:cupin domain-containing protein [Aurantimonas aggregata]|uniref:Cupin domain-containing protein n=1 Tax=Aurantimonas aggregata TaxID=2047720 RepID=A0A6L9ML08_9HYPH|nr:cupin domain-containing protein [Aurantimonas aggregata]NDV88574.1 cupin domain-containing protein [Aurantimonas aggregata]
MPKIGAKLLELRRRRDLTVREVASRSGLSPSTISLIERDRMSPSVNTIGAILDVLGSTLNGFFASLESTVGYSPFYQSADLVEIGNPKSISYRMIGVNHPNRDILILHERYVPGADTGEAFAHPAHEGGMVIAGSVELTVGGATRTLQTGDGYYFDSRERHRFRNTGDEPAEIVSAISPPTY